MLQGDRFGGTGSEHLLRPSDSSAAIEPEGCSTGNPAPLQAAGSKAGKWIPPVDDKLIDHLYDIFDGRIRFIMDAVTTLVTRLPEGVTATLSAPAARDLLQQLAQERVRSLLTDVEQQVLLEAAEQGKFTNSSLAQATGKSKQNVAKYLRRLIDLNFVRLAEKRGRSVYYETSAELALLRSRKG